jgi:hypothetical protein
MQRIVRTLRRHSALNLARETVWRARRELRRNRLPARLRRDCPVRFEPVGFYEPLPELLTAENKTVLAALGDEICRGGHPTLSYGTVQTGADPVWNRDFVSGRDWPHADAATLVVVRHDGSDVKAPWELSRLQVLPILGKAWQLTGDVRYRRRALAIVTDWAAKNPVGIGVNWTIAMEAAMRAVSICLCMELLWPFGAEEQNWVREVSSLLWQHLLFVEAHSEFSHLSRSNHYLSNVMGIGCLASVLRGRGMDGRRQRAAASLEEEMDRQVYADGGDFEASTGYHLEVAQMFTTAWRFMRARGCRFSSAFEQRLARMYELTATLATPEGRVPPIGDCDDGRVEWLSDDLREMMNPSIPDRHGLRVSGFVGLGSALFDREWGGSNQDALWLGYRSASAPVQARESVKVFAQTGIASARSADAQLTFLNLPNGDEGRGSHHHNDKLSVLLRLGEDELLADSGTGGYTRDAKIRNAFRRTAAHNTVTLQGREQNTIDESLGWLFRVGNEAAVSPIENRSIEDVAVFSASHSGYAAGGVVHHRTVQLRQRELTIADEFRGNAEVAFESSFMLPEKWRVEPECESGATVACRIRGPREVRLTASSDAALLMKMTPAEISPLFGVRTPATRITVAGTAKSVTTKVHWKS